MVINFSCMSKTVFTASHDHFTFKKDGIIKAIPVDGMYKQALGIPSNL